MEDYSIHTCSPPSPQIKSYFNPSTNKTLYCKVNVTVHEIGILFNYEINHARGVQWEDAIIYGIDYDNEEKDDGNWYEKTKQKTSNFFSNLFGKDDDDEDGEEEGEEDNENEEEGDDEDASEEEPAAAEASSAGGGGRNAQNLIDLEKNIMNQIWKTLLKEENKAMTWDWQLPEDGQQRNCAGLLIEEEEDADGVEVDEEAEDGNRRLVSIEKWMDEEIVRGMRELRQCTDGARSLEGDDGKEAGGGDILDTVPEDVLDTVDTASVDTAEVDADTADTNDMTTSTVTTAAVRPGPKTKLLGLTYEPLDYVNPNGCSIPSRTCTSINGQISAAYSGTNEYGVISTVIDQLRTGMENSSFLTRGDLLPPNHPALHLEFVGSGGTFAVSGSGMSITLNTARGTQPPQEEEETPPEDDLSKYGILFVCLVAVLGAGFLAATYVRYKKRKRRKGYYDEGVEMTEEEYEANLAMMRKTEMVEEGSTMKKEMGKKEEGDGMERGTMSGLVVPSLSGADKENEDDHHDDSDDNDDDVIHPSDSIIDQVELAEHSMDYGDDVEISLTPGSKTY
mmetsp:Transcript_2345/g.4292  ORF Transcript_2345/g.4292 Transcript_2345/m.4292 type:complete len:564 (+) Transcript_2345:1032-2723(+)